MNDFTQNITQALFNQDKVNVFEIQTTVNQLLNTFISIQVMSYNYFNRIHKGFGQVQDTLESYFE